ncbi:hypothetical protein ACS8E3_08455 [Psychrobacter sp. 2Y5]|uniref:hypothetical protein n=1 Tax=unclassified Psychrobacter TaxID=196806 RepID=UPI003F48800F
MSFIDPRKPSFSLSTPVPQSSTIKYKWLSRVSYTLLLASSAVVMAGCQSNKTLDSSANSSAALIDFSVTDPATMQAQGKAFNQSIQAQDERYQQLFDQARFPNSDSQAKRHLLSAIRQHLATEHVAVAQANYNAVPFIDADSIDAGSTGLLRTILEVYAYREEQENNDDETDSYDYSDSQQEADTVWIEDAEDPDKQYADYVEQEAQTSLNDYDDVVVYESEAATEDTRVAADFKVAYEVDGIEYDRDGYDIDGYDENGYDREGYDYYGDRTEDYKEDSGNTSFRERITDNNPKDWLTDFEAMQEAKQIEKDNSNNPGVDPAQPSTPGAISMVLSMLHKTPEQVAAANAYQYKYLTFNSVSQYLPKQRQFKTVYSYDYTAPTISSSVQLPLAFDFNTSKITIDPAAIMPIVALANPEDTPTQMTAHTVDFGLPEAITSQLPTAVIYDAAINAMQASMAELAPEHFSAVDIREDNFAKQVDAARAIKVNFGSKQTGEIVGKMLKYMSQSLQQYVDANPTQYPDDAMLKKAIDKIQVYNKGYQSADVGALLQLVEAIVPISFNQVNYYYLDSSDKLLAKQQRINIGGDLMGSNTTVLNQIRYDRSSFESSKLTPLLNQTFGANTPPAIDGNAWLAEQRQRKDRLEQARYARYDYDYDGGYDYKNAYDRSSDSATEAAD